MERIASLFEDGLNPNVIYGDGPTALHWASYHKKETRFKVYSPSMRALTPPQIWA
ncbi:MAG: hypothetical protein Ct9H90mP25_5450 [Gammaproteobacteria bacterium]|nr:MAG: hypothetical protein Ct9H90mP25_5450 [Gammaproteobacteria bacterium]